MAVIAPAVHVMNAALLKIGTDNYEKGVSGAKLTPTTPIGKWQGIDGSTTKAAGIADWILTLDFAQDFVTANSISQYMLANQGTTKVVELTPQAAGKKFTVTVLCVPTEVGGTAGQTAVATVSLEVVGQPTVA